MPFIHGWYAAGGWTGLGISMNRGDSGGMLAWVEGEVVNGRPWR